MSTPGGCTRLFLRRRGRPAKWLSIRCCIKGRTPTGCRSLRRSRDTEAASLLPVCPPQLISRLPAPSGQLFDLHQAEVDVIVASLVVEVVLHPDVPRQRTQVTIWLPGFL